MNNEYSTEEQLVAEFEALSDLRNDIRAETPDSADARAESSPIELEGHVLEKKEWVTFNEVAAMTIVPLFVSLCLLLFYSIF
jgi:hypothetical protein